MNCSTLTDRRFLCKAQTRLWSSTFSVFSKPTSSSAACSEMKPGTKSRSTKIRLPPWLQFECCAIWMLLYKREQKQSCRYGNREHETSVSICKRAPSILFRSSSSALFCSSSSLFCSSSNFFLSFSSNRIRSSSIFFSSSSLTPADSPYT